MTSGFLRGAEKDFADERLWGLGDEHGDYVSNVGGLNLAGVVLLTAAEAGVHGAGGDYGDADVVGPELFGDGVGEAIESPFRCGVSGSVREWVAAGEG